MVARRGMWAEQKASNSSLLSNTNMLFKVHAEIKKKNVLGRRKEQISIKPHPPTQWKLRGGR